MSTPRDVIARATAFPSRVIQMDYDKADAILAALTGAGFAVVERAALLGAHHSIVAIDDGEMGRDEALAILRAALAAAEEKPHD